MKGVVLEQRCPRLNEGGFVCGELDKRVSGFSIEALE